MKFFITWTIDGETEVEAASEDEAQRKFDMLANRAIAEDGERMQHTSPITLEEKKERAAEEEKSWEAFKASSKLRQRVPITGDGS